MVLEKFVGGNSHYDLTWLVFDESGEREHGTVSQAAEQAEKYQKSEKTRHDLSVDDEPRRFAASYDHVPEPLARPAAR
jgi:hypothetical protein